MRRGKAPAPAPTAADQPQDGVAAKQRGGARAGAGAKRKEANTPGVDASPVGSPDGSATASPNSP